MVKAVIFEGGEFIEIGTEPSQNHPIEMRDWSKESIEQAFVEHFGDDWADEETDMYDGEVRTMRECIDVVNNIIAQATTCPVDGGMTYLVRIVE